MTEIPNNDDSDTKLSNSQKSTPNPKLKQTKIDFFTRKAVLPTLINEGSPTVEKSDSCSTISDNGDKDIKKPISSQVEKNGKDEENSNNTSVLLDGKSSILLKKLETSKQSEDVPNPSSDKSDSVIVPSSQKTEEPPVMKETVNSGVEVLSSDEDESLSSLQKKLPPTPKKEGQVSKLNKGGKVNDTSEKIYNIVVSIDIDPQKWKSLSPQEQTLIIEQKKELARQHLINQKAAGKEAVLKQHQNQPLLSKIILPKVQSNHIPVQNILQPHVPQQSQISSLLHQQLYKPALNTKSPGTPHYQPVYHNQITRHTVPLSAQDFNRQFNYYQHNGKQDESFMPDLRPLPTGARVPMPKGFPNECFGDIIMIVEFVNAFQSLLSLKSKVTVDILMDAVSPGSEKVDVVANILLIFLNLLLGYEDYKVPGIKIELADLPLTKFTVSFLAYQLIKSQLETKKKMKKEEKDAKKQAAIAAKVAELGGVKDEKDSGSEDEDPSVDAAWLLSSSSEEDDFEEMSWQEKMERMKKKKMEEMNSDEHKLGLLANKLDNKDIWQLETKDQVQILTFLVELILESEDITDYYDQLNDDKQTAALDIYEVEKCKPKPVPVTLSHFAKKNEGVHKEDEDEDKEGGTGETAGMTKRQIEAIESEKKEKERKEQELQKAEHQERLNKFANLAKELRRASRVEPLGEDRYHRLYWFFPDILPGLYVSDKCVEVSVKEPLGTADRKEKWTCYDKEEDIKQLLSALTIHGLREDKLKNNIRAQQVVIFLSIKNFNKGEEQEKTQGNDKVLEGEGKTLNGKHDKVSSVSEYVKNGNSEDVDGSEHLAREHQSNGVERIEDNQVDIGENGCKPSGIDEEKTANGDDAETEKSNVNSSEIDEEKTGNVDDAKTKKSKVISPEIVNSSSELSDNEKDTEEEPIEKHSEKDVGPRDGFSSSIRALKIDMVESCCRVIHGCLGEMTDFENWKDGVNSSDSLGSLKQYVLQMHSCVYPKFFLKPLKEFQYTGGDITNEWSKKVNKCKSLSALHTFYGILENSIKWSCSVEKLRCKICRRKNGLDKAQRMIICDTCEMGYHLFCLKPKLEFEPVGDWNCPACTTTDTSSGSRARGQGRNQGGKAPVKEEPQKDEETDHEEDCHVCGTGGMLILCDTCPFSFHLECHNPPLHHAPRGNWSCTECVNKKAKKGQRKVAAYVKPKYKEMGTSSSEEEEGEDEEGSVSDEYVESYSSRRRRLGPARPVKTKKKPQKKKNSRAVRNMEESSGENGESGSNDGKSNEKEKGGSRRSARPGRASARAKKPTIESTDDDDNDDDDDDDDCTDSVKKMRKTVQKHAYKKKNTRKRKISESTNETDSEERDENQVSPTLGNRRASYAKDGGRKGAGRRKASEENWSDDDGDSTDDENTRKKGKGAKPKTKRTKKQRLSNDDDDEKGNEISRNFSSDHSSRQSSRNSRRGCNYEMEACRNIVNSLRKHKDSWPFAVPVNVKKFPDYLDVVEKPMDLSLILRNLDGILYDDVLQFVEDVKLIFENSKKYNPETSEVGQAGVKLNEEFQRLLKTHLPEMYATFS